MKNLFRPVSMPFGGSPEYLLRAAVRLTAKRQFREGPGFQNLKTVFFCLRAHFRLHVQQEFPY